MKGIVILCMIAVMVLTFFVPVWIYARKERNYRNFYALFFRVLAIIVLFVLILNMNDLVKNFLNTNIVQTFLNNWNISVKTEYSLEVIVSFLLNTAACVIFILLDGAIALIFKVLKAKKKKDEGSVSFREEGADEKKEGTRESGDSANAYSEGGVTEDTTRQQFHEVAGLFTLKTANGVGKNYIWMGIRNITRGIWIVLSIIFALQYILYLSFVIAGPSAQQNTFYEIIAGMFEGAPHYVSLILYFLFAVDAAITGLLTLYQQEKDTIFQDFPRYLKEWKRRKRREKQDKTKKRPDSNPQKKKESEKKQETPNTEWRPTMEDSAPQWEWTFMKENAEKPTDITKERKVKIEKVRKETNELFHANHIGTATLGTIGLIESDKKESEDLDQEEREIKEETEHRKKKRKKSFNPIATAIRDTVLLSEYDYERLRDKDTDKVVLTRKSDIGEDALQVPDISTMEAIDKLSKIPELQTEISIGEKIRENGNLLFTCNFHSPFSSFFLRYVNILLACGENVVFLCSKEEEIYAIREYIESFFISFLGMYEKDSSGKKSNLVNRSAWSIAAFTGKERGRRDTDLNEKNILITTPEYICSNEFEEYKEFINRINLFVLIDLTELINKFSVQLSLMNIKFRNIAERNGIYARNCLLSKDEHYRNQSIRYVGFDNFAQNSAIRQRLKDIFGRDNSFEVLDCSIISKDTAVDCYSFERTGKHTPLLNKDEFLANPLEMAIRASRITDGITIYPDGFPYRDMKNMIDGQEGILREYFPDDISYNGNSSQGGEPAGNDIMIVSDEYCNLPYTVRKYASMAEKKTSLLAVVSKPYLLRDYYASKLDEFWKEKQDMKTPALDVLSKAAALRILVKASSGGIAEDEIYRIVEDDKYFLSYIDQREGNNDENLTPNEKIVKILKVLTFNDEEEKRTAREILAKWESTHPQEASQTNGTTDSAQEKQSSDLWREVEGNKKLRDHILPYLGIKGGKRSLSDILLYAFEICGIEIHPKQLFDYFRFETRWEFDKYGEYNGVKNYIFLEKRENFCDILEGHNMIRLHFINSEDESSIPVPKERIYQNFLTGQNYLHEGCLYEIERIDSDKGVLYLRTEGVGKNSDAYEYEQDRTYLFRLTDDAEKTEFFLNPSEKESGKGKKVETYFYEVPMRVDTKGYYCLSPFTARVENSGDREFFADSTHGYVEMSAADRMACCRIYGDYEGDDEDLAEIAVAGGRFFTKQAANVLSFVFETDISNELQRDKVSYQLGIMMNELIRTYYPLLCDSVKVITVQSESFDADEECRRDRKATHAIMPKLSEAAETVIRKNGKKIDANKIEVLVIEDSPEKLGVISSLRSTDGNALADFFTQIAEYLDWLTDGEIAYCNDVCQPKKTEEDCLRSEGREGIISKPLLRQNSDYLHYGKSSDLSCFDSPMLYQIALQFGNGAHYGQKKVTPLDKREYCCACCSKVLHNSDKLVTLHHRYMCTDCFEQVIGHKPEQLKKLENRVRSDMHELFGIRVPDDEYPINYGSTEEIETNYGKTNAFSLDSDPDSLVKAYIESGTKPIAHIEYEIPPSLMEETLVNQLAYLWLLKNGRESTFHEWGRGVALYATLRYLTQKGADQIVNYRKRQYRAERQTDSAGFIYCKLLKQLRDDGRRNVEAENIFRYLQEKNALVENIAIETISFHTKEIWKNTLSEEYQKAYEEIYYALDNYADKVTFTADADGVSLNRNAIRCCILAVLYDHPELFYTKPELYQSGDPNEEVAEFDLFYTIDRKTAKEESEKIVRETEKILSRMNENEFVSDYQKAIYLHDAIVSSTDYDSFRLEREGYIAPLNDRKRNILGVFLDHAAVCAGYAKALGYLYRKVGIECAYIAGTVIPTSQEENSVSTRHAWNLVKLQGEYCYIDATWDDSTTNVMNESEKDPYIYHNYFGITTEEILKTRKLDGAPVPEERIPTATAVKNNYFYQITHVINQYNNVARNTILNWIEDEGKNSPKDGCVGVKFTDEETYDKYREAYMEDDQLKGEIKKELLTAYCKKAEREETDKSLNVLARWRRDILVCNLRFGSFTDTISEKSKSEKKEQDSPEGENPEKKKDSERK